MKNLSLLFIAFLFIQFKSFAQEGWQTQNSGISITYSNLNSVFYLSSSSGWAAGGGTTGNTWWGVITHTTNGGTNWEEQTIPVSCEITSVYFVNDSIGWASTLPWGVLMAPGYILKSTDSGANWSILREKIYGNFNDIFFIDENTGWTVGGDDELIDKTTDGGTTWTSQYSGANTTFKAIHFIDDNTGWAAGGYTSGGFWNGLVTHTTNGGVNWEVQTLNPIYPSSLFNDVQFIDEDTGWITGWKYDGGGGSHVPVLYKTTDGGISWIEKSLPVTEFGELNSLHFADANNGWAVGMFGNWDGSLILRTTNGGEDWVEQEHSEINSLFGVYFINNNEGWTVGDSCTILHTTNGGVSFIEENEIQEVASEFTLSNNYPNPFNPSTKIRYSVPQSSQVQIKVFDILGNEVETLVDEEKPTGTYELTWYADRLPSGVYFYRLQAGDFVETKKMVLMK